MEIITKSAQETFDLGQKIGSSLKARLPARQGGEVLALVGELGAGKTTFIQGLAKSLGITSKIISPTFILMRKYDDLYHIDLYRLEGNLEKEVENLGFFDVLKDKENVVVIEWAEKIKNLLPKSTMWINFEIVGENERKITIQ